MNSEDSNAIHVRGGVTQNRGIHSWLAAIINWQATLMPNKVMALPRTELFLCGSTIVLAIRWPQIVPMVAATLATLLIVLLAERLCKVIPRFIATLDLARSCDSICNRLLRAYRQYQTTAPRRVAPFSKARKGKVDARLGLSIQVIATAVLVTTVEMRQSWSIAREDQGSHRQQVARTTETAVSRPKYTDLHLMVNRSTAQKVRVRKDLKITLPDGSIHRTALDGAIAYRWQRGGEELLLYPQSVEVRQWQDAVEKESGKADINGIEGRQEPDGPIVREVDSPETRQRLREMFAEPICALRVDRSGKILNLAIVDSSYARAQVHTGIVQIATFFNPWFPAGHSEWEAYREAETGPGAVASGMLLYKIVSPTPPAGAANSRRVTVSVSGTLRGTRRDGLEATESRYDVVGEQVFDRSLGEWVAGDLLIGVQLESAGPNGVSSAQGMISYSMEKVDSATEPEFEQQRLEPAPRLPGLENPVVEQAVVALGIRP